MPINPVNQVPHLQVGEVGVKLTLDTGLPDLSVFTTFTILATKPNKRLVTFAAAIEGPATDGKISYTFAAGDLDRAGIWIFQAQVEDAGGAKLIGEGQAARVKAIGEV